MKELLLIAIGSALVNNVVLSQFLGLCPFLGVSKKTETAAGMGAAVVFVITIASACTSLVYDFVLVKLHIEYLQTIVFILVIAALVQFVEMFLKKNMVIPSVNYNKLCGSRCCADKRTEGLQLHSECRKRYRYFRWIPDRHRPACRYP